MKWMLSIIGFFTLVFSAQGTSYDWSAKPLTDVKINTVAYRGWTPEHTGPLAGTLVLIPGRHGDGRSMADDGRWQELAKEAGLAIIACQFSDGEPGLYQFDANGEVAGAINQAVEHLAVESQRPELAKGPLALWGTSAGSNVSACYCARFPARVLAFASSKGTYGPGGNVPPATREIPMFFALGGNDKPEWTETSRDNIAQGTKLSAPWTLALNKSEGHDLGRSLDVIIPFFKAAIQQRLSAPTPVTGLANAPKAGFKTQLPGFSKPATATTTTVAPPKLYKIDQQNGWLGDPETYEVASAKEFKGKKTDAVWLADEATAKAWKAYLQ